MCRGNSRSLRRFFFFKKKNSFYEILKLKQKKKFFQIGNIEKLIFPEELLRNREKIIKHINKIVKIFYSLIISLEFES